MSDSGEQKTPFVKISSTEIAPQPTVHVNDDVYLYVDLVNMGSAETRPGDTLTGTLLRGGGSIHQESVNLETISPDGGSWRHVFKFEGHYVMEPGEWELDAMVTNQDTIGEVQDSDRKSFQVEARES